ncbi:uncharacterized protein LOC102570960 [Alligator mississippiensis]|uniref:uncharacterized protein LOC102570960 n=1 Tax=Alligator mississippiensis TaxID=8496 RepID=UPI002877DE9B|nr:uncharacterized protein LOC102570960 [Alligator mississippiensis]
MKKEHAPIPSLPMAKCPYLNSCTFQMKVAGGQTPASLSKSECGKPNLNGCSRASEKGSDSKGVNFLRPRESCKVTFDFSKPYTTSHSRMAGFPALLLLLALTGTSVEQDIEVQKKVQGDSLHTGCSYNKHKYSLEKKYLCKELSRNCPVLASISPAGGKNDPHPATKNTISLKDTGYGWISVIMMALRVEDSGTYQCKLYDSLKSIILKRIKVLVAYEAPLRLSANEGDSISLNCSYTVMGERRSHQYFTLCKMVTTTNCQPAIRMNYYYNVHTSGKIRITNDQENYMITATLRQLRYQDSGEYRCCSHFMSQNMFLRAIHLVVSKKPWNPSSVLEVTSSPTSSRGAIHPTVASNEQQRTLYIVVVLGVLLASVALITAFTLLALTFIKRREAGKFFYHSSLIPESISHPPDSS